MSSGLLALLDDIVAIAKVAATSIDDVALHAAKASTKAAGVVIDDAAVTPKYVVGLSPAREIPIIWNIAKGSLKNKLLFLTPTAILLGWMAPWAINPLLAFGGAFLCFEGYEKLHHILHQYFHGDAAVLEVKEEDVITPEELEKIRTNGAIRTDFILSAEIIDISYATVATKSVLVQFFSLLVVALVITAIVYGFVALIVKADDFGLHLAKAHNPSLIRAFGRALIKIMPAFLTALSYIGTAAMLWVGGGIVIHTIPLLHHHFADFFEQLHLVGLVAWSSEAFVSALFGIAVGFIVLNLAHLAKTSTNRKKAPIA
jgi:uncharacterized protein